MFDHMFDTCLTHVSHMSGEMDKETLGLKELEEGALVEGALGVTNEPSTSTECRSCECFKAGMPNTEGFRSTFMELHYGKLPDYRLSKKKL